MCVYLGQSKKKQSGLIWRWNSYMASMNNCPEEKERKEMKENYMAVFKYSFIFKMKTWQQKIWNFCWRFLPINRHCDKKKICYNVLTSLLLQALHYHFYKKKKGLKDIYIKSSSSLPVPSPPDVSNKNRLYRKYGPWTGPTVQFLGGNVDGMFRYINDCPTIFLPMLVVA